MKIVMILLASLAACAGTDDPGTDDLVGDGKADSTVATDYAARKLATLLGGKTLLCGGSDAAAASSEPAGFFPITVTATPRPNGATRLEINTTDPSVGFGDGGDEIDPVEYSKRWFILGEGDDGRRHLMFQNWWAGDRDELACLNPAVGDGDIAGVVTEIWDAGHITSRGVQCCLR